MNNLLLCGFMGCGKTTVGRQLARQLKREYIDLDEQIAADAGLPIPEIFAQFGEDTFRQLEHEAVTALALRINCIVALGGGAMAFPRNIDAISPHDQVVFLDAPFEVCYDRIRYSDRPILRQSTPAAFRTLFDTRRTAYLTAAQKGFTVDAGGDSSTVISAILPHLH